MRAEYTEMPPEQRFSELDRMAPQLFGSNRWKTAFCRRYGLTPQTITAWSNKGAPVWALVAISDALDAQKLAALTQLVAPIVGADAGASGSQS